MNTDQKKTYEVPSVVAYGAVEDLTKQGGPPNSDVFHGRHGTAYSTVPL